MTREEFVEKAWRYKNYDLHYRPKKIPKYYPNDYYETFEFVYWQEVGNGRKRRKLIAQWVLEKNGYEFHFIGAKPLKYVSSEDAAAVWHGIDVIQSVLDKWQIENCKQIVNS